MVKKNSQILTDLEYYISGINPKLLIHTGTHGDEYEVIGCVKNSIEKYFAKLPDFVFVPKVSPSAVKAKTRFNSSGIDINRVFYSNSDEIEVVENIRLLEGYNFDLMISFHEDPDFFDYYIYDESQNKIITNKVITNNLNIKKLGVNLLTGMDDSGDPHLGHKFIDGYAEFIYPDNILEDGTATVWAYSNNVAKSILVPEIPGKINLSLKQKVVDKIFEDIFLN